MIYWIIFVDRKLIMRKNEKEKKKLKKILAKEQGLELTRSGPSRKALKSNKIEKNPADITVVSVRAQHQLQSYQNFIFL